MRERAQKQEQLRISKAAELDKLAAGKKISQRSEIITNNQRRNAWNEIFDVLLWSVSFATRSFEKDVNKLSNAPIDVGFSISTKNEILDTKKAMPQLIRPQDLANVVQSLFHQLLPTEQRLTREEFIMKMEAFTAGHGFVHTPVEGPITKSDSTAQASGVSVAKSQQQSSIRSQDGKNYLSRELSSFASIAEDLENRKPNSKIQSQSNSQHTLQVMNSTIDGSKSALNVAPSAFPINMLLNSRSSIAMSGQLKLKDDEHNAMHRNRRSKSSERRVATASELLGTAYNNYAIHKRRSVSANRTRFDVMPANPNPSFIPRMEACAKSAKLAYRGEHGERRKLGLSVGVGLHSCKPYQL